MSEKCLLTFEGKNIEVASVFETRDDAAICINQIISECDSIIQRNTRVTSNHYELELVSGVTFTIKMAYHDVKLIRYSVMKLDSYGRQQVKYFISKMAAVRYVHKDLDKNEFEPTDMEDKVGLWSFARDGEEETKYLLQLELLKPTVMKKYYDILGVDYNATQTQIKEAYRRKSKESHPDRGGSAEEFERVHNAYKKISGTQDASEEHKEILKMFMCSDFVTVLRNTHEAAQYVSARTKAAYDMYSDVSLKPLVRAKAAKWLVVGLVIASIGGGLTAASYNATDPGGKYVIFTGLIVWGGWYILKGLFYLIFPGAGIKKL